MINHVRTLLLNRDSRQTGPGSFGYEYVPPNYSAATLPSELQRLVRCLFGSAADLAGMNYRLRQFMPFLHAAEIEAFTLMDDSRITYDLSDDRLFRESFAPRLVNVNTTVGVKYVIPPGALETDTGKLEYRCFCKAANDVYSVVDDPSNQILVPTTWDNGLSEPLQLPNSGGISIMLAGSGMTEGESFSVLIYKKPKIAVADLPSQLAHILNDEVEYKLFGPGAPGRFGQFAAWWHESDQLHFRLAGVLLALAYRTDLIRQGG